MNIRHVGVVVTDMDKSLDFYTKLLGMRVVWDKLEDGSVLDAISGIVGVQVRTVKLECPGHETLLELLDYKAPPSSPRPQYPITDGGVSHVALSVDKLPELWARMAESGTIFHCRPQLSGDGKVLVTFCRGPSGELLELVQGLA